MPKNDYARRMMEKQDRLAHIHVMWGVQFALDVMTIVLADAEVMGKDTIGPKRRTAINAEISRIMEDHILALTQNQESDYMRDDVDRRLKQIMGNDFMPWKERYDNFADEHGGKRKC